MKINISFILFHVNNINHPEVIFIGLWNSLKIISEKMRFQSQKVEEHLEPKMRIVLLVVFDSFPTLAGCRYEYIELIIFSSIQLIADTITLSLNKNIVLIKTYANHY